MKTFILALAILSTPAAVLAACSAPSEEAAMSCVEGTIWDDARDACVPIVIG